MAACREMVNAGDEVLAVAEEGMRHWSDHVQAQTDANAGKITSHRMDETFARTRLAGAADAKRYEEAVDSYRAKTASCHKTDRMPVDLADLIGKCADRAQAQQLVLRAADNGMSDWVKHLADMRRSARGHAVNAKKTWLETWRAAPPAIDAYQEAVKGFDAPRC